MTSYLLSGAGGAWGQNVDKQGGLDHPENCHEKFAKLLVWFHALSGTSCVKDAVGVRGSLLIWKLLTMPWKPKAGNSSKSCGFPFYNDALSLVSNGAHDLNSLLVRKTLQFGYVGWLKPFNPGLVGEELGLQQPLVVGSSPLLPPWLHIQSPKPMIRNSKFSPTRVFLKLGTFLNPTVGSKSQKISASSPTKFEKKHHHLLKTQHFGTPSTMEEITGNNNLNNHESLTKTSSLSRADLPSSGSKFSSELAIKRSPRRPTWCDPLGIP